MKVLVATRNETANGLVSKVDKRPDAVTVEIEACFDHIAPRFGGLDAPDILVLDFDFPEHSGIAGIHRALELVGHRPLAALVSAGTPELHAVLISAGCRAILPFGMTPDAFGAAMILLKTGSSFVAMDQQAGTGERPTISPLSKREAQVLNGICKGLPNKEIAHSFQIQEVTVKMHVRAIIRKLGARNRTHAAMIARNLAII